MTKDTTDDAVRVVGAERPHQAVRQLARACIALVRWRREQGLMEVVSAPAEPIAPPRRPA